MPRQPRRRPGVAQQRVDLADRALLVVGGVPDLAEPLPQPVDRLQLGGVMVAPACPAEAVQVLVQRRQIADLLAVDAVAVDQHTRGPQCELGVMTKNHLTHDPFRR